MKKRGSGWHIEIVVQRMEMAGNKCVTGRESGRKRNVNSPHPSQTPAVLGLQPKSKTSYLEGSKCHSEREPRSHNDFAGDRRPSFYLMPKRVIRLLCTSDAGDAQAPSDGHVPFLLGLFILIAGEVLSKPPKSSTHLILSRTITTDSSTFQPARPMESRYMGYPSPRGVHVPEKYANNDDNDLYRRNSVHSPRRNRYSRSVHQTPRVRDVTWISSPDPTPQTLHGSPTPWLPPPQVPSSPAYRPPSAVPPSPAPTVGEHMVVDDLFTQDPIMDPHAYQPQRQDGGVGLFKSVWKGLKKLSGFQSTPYIPRTSSYESQTVEMPVPRVRAPSVGSPGTDPEQYGVTPYTSPYVRPTNIGATPAVIPNALHASPASVPHVEIPPPITVVSPSIPSSRHSNSIRSVRMASPAMPVPQNLSVRGLEPVASPIEEGSQTLHEPFPDPVRPLFPFTLAPPVDEPMFPTSSGDLDSPLTSKGSRSSTMARMRRFIAELGGLPWVSDTQIANEYVPEMNPRSRMRKRERQGAEPSWYNPRPEAVEELDYWSQWDMWAKQSTAALWDGMGGERRAVGWGGAGGPGQWGVMYPHGYVPAQPGFVYPSGYLPPGVVGDQVHAPVLP